MEIRNTRRGAGWKPKGSAFGADPHLIGAILLEQNDEWTVQRARYKILETMAALSDDPIVKLPAVAA